MQIIGTTQLKDVELTGAIVKLLIVFNQTHDKDHSLQYTLEECLLAGITAKNRSKEYSEATQNRKKFEKEIAADPTVVLDPERMAKLCRKFGIGGTAVAAIKTPTEVEAALEAATAPPAASEAAA